MTIWTRAVALVAAGLLAAGCSQESGSDGREVAAGGAREAPGGALPQGAEPVQLDPASFVETIDHPYWPMTPGSRWVYRETDGEGNVQRVEVEVTGETREVMGIAATVVHDLVTENGQPVEDTFDWYAQDRDGNLWYMGEVTEEYENGEVVSTAGSWEAGKGGGQPGIILPGRPRVGQTYRQEYLAGEAEDLGAILSLGEMSEVPAGFFEDVLMTKDFTPLEPRVLEYKHYARGVGPVQVVAVSGGFSQEVLVSYERG